MLNLISKKSDRNQIRVDQSFADKHVDLRVSLSDDIFLLANSDLLAVLSFDFSSISDECLTNDDLNSEYVKFTRLLRLLRGIPEYEDGSNVIIQVCMWQEKVKRNHLSKQTNYCGEILSNEDDFLLKRGLLDKQFLISIRMSPLKESFLGSLKKLINKKKTVSYVEKLNKQKDLFRKTIESKLIESKIKAKFLSSSELISTYNKILSGGGNKASLDGKAFFSLHESVFTKQIQAFDDRLETEDQKIKVFVLKELPNLFAYGRFRLFLQNIPFEKFYVTTTLSHGSSEPTSDLTLKKVYWANAPAYQKNLEEIIFFEKEISRQNPMLFFSLKIICYSPTEDQISKLFAVSSDILGIPIYLEKDIATHLIATALPGNCAKDAHAIPGRVRRTSLNIAASFLPLFKEKPEVGFTPTRLWSSRTLDPISFDFFPKGNSHTLILGTSGAGKSNFLGEVLIEFYARYQTGYVRIVDRKTSYGKLSDLIGGKVISFSEETLKKEPFSPFYSDDYEEDSISNILSFILFVLQIKNPKENISSIFVEVLNDALKRAAIDFKKNKEIDPSSSPEHFVWSDIQRQIPVAASVLCDSTSSEVCDKIGLWTSSFEESGSLGFIFSSYQKQKKDAKDQLLIFDLDGITDPIIQKIASFLSFLTIQKNFKRLPRESKKLLIFEELGVFLAGDSPETQAMGERFVRDVIKTARKQGIQAFGLSNEVEDFLTPGGKTFWSVGTCKIFLPQGNGAPSLLKEHYPQYFDEADTQILEDLQLVKGSHSEALIKKQNYKASIQIPLSPIMNAIVTTTPEEEACYAKFKKDGLSTEQSLEKMACEHPYGKDL